MSFVLFLDLDDPNHKIKQILVIVNKVTAFYVYIINFFHNEKLQLHF